MRFIVGSKVKCKSDEDGVVGSVVSVLKSTGGYKVLFPVGGCALSEVYVPESDLVCAERPSTPSDDPNPKKAYGEQKPNMALVPPASMLHEAMAFEAGARKYGAYNFRQYPVEAMTYIAAAMRHLQNYLDGEEYCSDDPTVHNLGAAKAGLGILLDSIEQGILIDNRPPAGRSSDIQERMKAAKVARSKK